MADKIVNPDNYDWSGQSREKGKTKYLHLLDGNAREIDVREYGHTNPANFAVILRTTARRKGLVARCIILDDNTVVFQVTGKR
jgi:hypothetical protein